MKIDLGGGTGFQRRSFSGIRVTRRYGRRRRPHIRRRMTRAVVGRYPFDADPFRLLRHADLPKKLGNFGSSRHSGMRNRTTYRDQRRARPRCCCNALRPVRITVAAVRPSSGYTAIPQSARTGMPTAGVRIGADTARTASAIRRAVRRHCRAGAGRSNVKFVRVQPGQDITGTGQVGQSFGDSDKDQSCRFRRRNPRSSGETRPGR
jgi:hypothetical protein